MFNYLLKIEYEGTNFVGWQSQKNGKSIQDSIEKSLKKVLGTKIKIRVSTKSFLQNQVRSMVGCLKYLSTYKWSLDDFKKAFKSKKWKIYTRLY